MGKDTDNILETLLDFVNLKMKDLAETTPSSAISGPLYAFSDLVEACKEQTGLDLGCNLVKDHIAKLLKAKDKGLAIDHLKDINKKFSMALDDIIARKPLIVKALTSNVKLSMRAVKEDEDKSFVFVVAPAKGTKTIENIPAYVLMNLISFRKWEPKRFGKCLTESCKKYFYNYSSTKGDHCTKQCAGRERTRKSRLEAKKKKEAEMP